jgi:hypothetical protein
MRKESQIGLSDGFFRTAVSMDRRVEPAVTKSDEENSDANKKTRRENESAFPLPRAQRAAGRG